MRDRYCLTRREMLGLLGSAAVFGAGFKFGKEKITNFVTKPKQNKFIAGVDFEAYGNKAYIRLSNGEYKAIDFSSRWYSTVANWAKNMYANLLSIIPYYPEKMYSSKEDYKDKGFEEMTRDQNSYDEYKFELLKEGDDLVRNLLTNDEISGKRYLILRLKNFSQYTLFNEDNFLDHLATNVANVSKLIQTRNSIIELEAGLRESPEQLSEIFKRTKYIYPQIINAISITDYVDPQKKEKLWNIDAIANDSKDADIAIINDYASTPQQLKENILNFKKVLKKKVLIRVITGQLRKDYGFAGDERDLESMLKTCYENADGCIVSDLNGAWLYDGVKNPLDNGRRKMAISNLYFQFLNYETEKKGNQSAPQILENGNPGT